MVSPSKREESFKTELFVLNACEKLTKTKPGKELLDLTTWRSLETLLKAASVEAGSQSEEIKYRKGGEGESGGSI